MKKKRKSKPLKNVTKKKTAARRKTPVKKSKRPHNKKSRKRNSTGKGSKKKVAVSKNKRKIPSSKSVKKGKDVKNNSGVKSSLRFEFPRNKDDKRKAGNVIIIYTPQKTFQAKINAIINWSGNELKKFINRYSKFPQAVQVILTTKKGRDTFQRASRISPYDFVVNAETTKKFILEMMIAFQDNYLEYIESDEPRDSDWVYNPSKIIAITVRFIY